MAAIMFSKRTAHILVSLALLAIMALASTVQAQSGTVTDDDVNRVAKEMYCPTCENTPLDVCPTQTCQDWRDLIRQQLADGWTKEEILTYFGETFGDHVLAEPPRRGFDLVVWLLPVFGLIAGATLLYRYLTSIRTADLPQTAPASAASTHPASAADDYLARVEQELRDRQ
jgi:cytochrome c-type biogenesis protein CcmH